MIKLKIALLKAAGALLLLFLLVAIGQMWGAYIFTNYGPMRFVSVSPLTLYQYWVHNGGQVWFYTSYKIGFITAVGYPIVVVIGLIYLALTEPKRKLHGDAKFASRLDLQKEKLLKPDNNPPDILIGQTKDGEYLRWSSAAFAFLAAPTRSGKGVGVVIPNCLHYRESLVVFDPKLENYKITSGYRQACGQEVYLFNPSTQDFKSHRWNPLSYVRRNRFYTTGDAFNIANILYSTSGGGDGGNSVFFNEMAQKLFVGLVLFMMETESASERMPTLGLLNSLTAPDALDDEGKPLGFADWIKRQCVADTNDYGIELSKECQSNLLSYTNNSANTASGILSSMLAPLSAFSEPIVQEVTSGDDFDLRDVRKKKMTIYVGVNPNDFDKFKRLINLFFSQLISVNTAELPEENPELKYQCLLLIDEFGAMGKVDIIESGVAYMAGYNLRLLLIFQNLSQLNRLYTQDGARTLVTNFDCQILYPPRDHKDAQEYSEITGYETVKSTSINRDGVGIGKRSESISDQRRALLLPQEFTAMDEKECVISMRSMKPIHCRKIIYYQDPTFKARLGYEPASIPELGIKPEDDNSITADVAATQPDPDLTLAQFNALLFLPANATEQQKQQVAEQCLSGDYQALNAILMAQVTQAA